MNESSIIPSSAQTPFFASAAVLLAVYGVPFAIAAMVSCWAPSLSLGIAVLIHLLLAGKCCAFGLSSTTRVDTAKIVMRTLVACLILDVLAIVCMIGIVAFVIWSLGS